MKKNSLKYFLDTILFIDICSIAAIGAILGFVFPKGNEKFSTKFFLGLHKHDWGNIHFNLSTLLLILLIFYLWLNWTWIIQSTKRYFGKNWKNALWCISGAWIFVLIMGWIAVKT